MNTNKKLDAEMQLYSDIVKARHNVAHDNIEQHKTFREIKKALILYPCNF